MKRAAFSGFISIFRAGQRGVFRELITTCSLETVINGYQLRLPKSLSRLLKLDGQSQKYMMRRCTIEEI